MFKRCDEITGGKVDTTAGVATGDVKTRGFAGRNLFGDKTCCGALATVICGAGLRLATVDEMVNSLIIRWVEEQIRTLLVQLAFLVAFLF